MSLFCFFVPARQPDPAQSELNAFLATERVVAVQREWLADGEHSGWAFCVEVLSGQRPLPGALKDCPVRILPGRLVAERGL